MEPIVACLPLMMRTSAVYDPGCKLPPTDLRKTIAGSEPALGIVALTRCHGSNQKSACPYHATRLEGEQSRSMTAWPRQVRALHLAVLARTETA